MSDRRIVEQWSHGDPARHSKIGEKPQIALYTVSPKERDCRLHVPWDPAHPLYRSCPPRLEYVRYTCGHEYYRTSKQEGWTSDTIRARLKAGISWGQDLAYLCPRCWSDWSLQKLPRFEAPRVTVTRPLRPLERLQRSKFTPRTVI